MFILDRPKSESETYIFLLYSCADGRFKRSTKLKALPSKWDFETERPKLTKGDKNTTRILLDKLYAAIDTLETERQKSGKGIYISDLDNLLGEVLGLKTKAGAGVSFVEGSKLIIAAMERGELLNNRNKHYSKSSIDHYGWDTTRLLEFAKEEKVSVEWADVTLETYNKFIVWGQKKDWSTNQIGASVQSWKGLLGNGIKLGLHTNSIAEHKKFKRPTEQTDDVYLEEPDLQKMRGADLTDKQRLACDWFMIASFTGLRSSDIKLLRSAIITKTDIMIATEKTDEPIIIPIHPIVKEILKRHKGFPPAMHGDEINIQIKEVAKKAGLTAPFLYVLTKGGKRKDHHLKTWEMVSLHTARRSFITNAAIAGMPDTIIMKLTGIKSVATLERYKKLTQKGAARLAAAHPFFQNK